MQPSLRLAVACVLQLSTCGPLFAPPVLYGSIAASFGVEQAHVTALMPAAYAVSTFAMAVPGSLFMERFGLQKSFLVGCVGICLCTLAQVASSSLLQLVLLHGLIGACKAFAGDVAFIAFCTAWFDEHTSTAIAICFAAVGAGGMVWTFLAAKVASALGWRAALALVAAAQCLIALPLATCCMREPPSGGLVRRPSRVARHSSHEAASAGPLPWWLLDRSVWLLATVSFGVVYAPSGGPPLLAPSADLTACSARAWLVRCVCTLLH
jgi:MFS family permease